MNFKFWYMKVLGFLISIIGFIYSLTSFYNFFEVIFGNKIIVENANLWIMGLGLVFPLFVFVFGVFFYFVADILPDKTYKWIDISIVIVFLSGLINILLSIESILALIGQFKYLTEYVHDSFGYIILILGVFLAWGKKRFKY